MHSPTSGRVVLHSKLVDGGCRVQFPVVLVNLVFGVFPGFLWDSHKYGLGSLRKFPHREHSTYSPRSHKQTIEFKPTTTPIKMCTTFAGDWWNRQWFCWGSIKLKAQHIIFEISDFSWLIMQIHDWFTTKQQNSRLIVNKKLSLQIIFFK